MHSSEEDVEALNADLTQLTLEDFSNNCNICGLRFLTKNSLAYHKNVEHRMGVEKSAECEKCKKVVKPSNLKSHMITHQEKNFVCQLCYAKLSSKKNLKTHIINKHREDNQYLNRTISNEELTWPCNQCELRFVAKKFLESHLKKHASMTCKLCYKKFSDIRNRLEHEKGVHKKEAQYLGREILDCELVHECKKCEQKFVTNDLLLSHKRKHELEKYEPMRVEAYNKNTKKYECKFCYTNYTKFSELVYHIELVHKSDLDKIEEKIITADLLRFSCDGCDLRKR